MADRTAVRAMVKRVGLHLATLAALYLLFASFVSSLPLRFRSARGVAGPLPNVRALERSLDMYGIFSGYDTHQSRWRIMGSNRHLPSPPATPTTSMIELDLDDYFPQVQGDVVRRVSFWLFRDVEKPALYARLCDRLQRLHNQGERIRVEQVFLYREQWPSDPRGRSARYSERTAVLVGHN